MDEFKIQKNNISKFNKRFNNKSLRVILIGFSSSIILYIPLLIQLKTNKLVLFSFMIGFLLTMLFIFLVYINNRKLTNLIAENLVVKISDEYISKHSNLENESKMSFFNKLAYNRLPQYHNVHVLFSDIDSVTFKNGDLWIYSKQSNKFNGSGILVIPQELEGFEEISIKFKNFM